jgi:hypothetical protein
MNFSRKNHASRYFLLCTVQLDDCALGTELLDLRRSLAWNGMNAEAEQFHATKDPEAVRSQVYELLSTKKFRIDATLLEKSKMHPEIRTNRFELYKHAWYVHFKHCGKDIAKTCDELLIQAASIGTNKERSAFRSAIQEVAEQVLVGIEWRTTFWSASSDPCLQIADYCAWAIQRAYERGDDRRLKQIEHNVASCYDLYALSDRHYY